MRKICKKKKDKILHFINCDVDIDEVVDKKKKFEETQFNDGSRHFSLVSGYTLACLYEELAIW